MSSSNPLGAASLSKLISQSLPSSSSTNEPQLKTATDAIAIACHAGMLSVGFRLLGLDEESSLDTSSTSDSPQPLPPQWSLHHTFRYAHSQSSMQYILRISKLGARTVINGIGIGDDKTASFDVTTNDYISTSSLPATLSSTSTDDAIHIIQTVFISPSRLTDLGSSLRLNIIQKLVPGLQKEGYEGTSTTTTTENDDRGPRNTDPAHHPLPRHDPLRDDPLLPRPAQPRNPLADPSVGPRRPPVPAGDFPPPGFDDEYDMFRPPGRGGSGVGIPAPGRSGGFPRIGDRDLYPPGMGPDDPLRIGPGGRPRGGGGMHPTFDDFAQFGDEDQLGGRGMQAPPGSRFDPPGPGFGPPRGSGGFGSGGGGGGFFGGGGGGGFL